MSGTSQLISCMNNSLSSADRPRPIAVMAWSLRTVAVLAWSVVAADPSTSVMVRTCQRRLKGSILETYTGTSFFAFRGVRYAESPTGDYRFKPPVPVKPWGDEVKNATEDGAICPQPLAELIGTFSSEDCLFLNVYSKELSETAKQPVMVYLHAGGFAGITGNSYWEGPQYLLNKDIVLVTINYRLGALGFVSTGDGILPGNYGMKDQVEALKWVQQNIAFFGGDPDRVTLWGCSAGGASVMMHLVSPLSRGLFHRAISMSGSFSSGGSMNRRPKALAERLAVNLGCNTSDSGLIYACLMRHTATEIVNATIPIRDLDFLPSALLFAPVVEPGSGNDRFLPEDPLTMMIAGNITQVSVVVGVTYHEFAARGYNILLNKTLTEEYNQKFEQFAPIEFAYEREGETSKKISAAIRKFYLKEQPISNETRTKFMEIYTDAQITFSVMQAAKLIASKNLQPVYLYRFSYQGRFSHDYIPGTQTPIGISHHDDMIYLVYISKLFPEFNSTDPDARMVRTLTAIWTNFAETGVPAIPYQSTVWQPLQNGQDRYLNITTCPEMVTGLPFPKRMAFWESQFPLTGPRQQLY